MPVAVLEGHAASTAAGYDGSGRVSPSIEAALEAFETEQAPTSVDGIETEKLASDRVAITVTYTE